MDLSILNAPPYSVSLEINTGVDYSAIPYPITRLEKFANHTLVLTDAYKLIDMNVGSSNTVTIPLNSAVPYDLGTVILISQYGAGTTSIVATGGVTIRSESSYVKIAARYAGAVLIKIGTDEWYLQGALSA